MDGPKKKLTFLHIRGITTFLCFKTEVGNPPFSMEKDITVGSMPVRLIVGDKCGKHRLCLAHDIPQKTVSIRFLSSMLTGSNTYGRFLMGKDIVKDSKSFRCHLEIPTLTHTRKT
jgi:hypothetical protein